MGTNFQKIVFCVLVLFRVSGMGLIFKNNNVNKLLLIEHTNLLIRRFLGEAKYASLCKTHKYNLSVNIFSSTAYHRVFINT